MSGYAFCDPRVLCGKTNHLPNLGLLAEGTLLWRVDGSGADMGIRYWQRDVNRRSATWLALGPDRAAVGHDDLLGDRQAQPCAAAAARARAIRAVEAVEDIRQIFRRDALACIGNTEDNRRPTTDDRRIL